MKNKKCLMVIALCGILLTSCAKSWLDIKPDRKIVVPQNLKDLQAILDNDDYMNNFTPLLGEVSAGDFYLNTNIWLGLQAQERNAYIWAKDVYEGAPNIIIDWDWNYRKIFYSNVVLEELKKIDTDNRETAIWNNIKGSALFYRAWNFFQLAQIFCKNYDPITAESDLGIVLKLSPNVNAVSTRASVEQTYQQIITDLKGSLDLLPNNPEIKTRPSKSATLALLAKAHLQMGNYQIALEYAEKCLELGVELIDYNTIDSLIAFPFSKFNKEIIFHTNMGTAFSLATSRMIVDSTLIASYQPGDLRSKLFFTIKNDLTVFRGSYDGSTEYFSGIATDELYLILAECYARTNDIPNAKKYLFELLQNRYIYNHFEDTFLEQESLLHSILEERRKELIFRGIRWSDLRRLNRENRFQVELVRRVDDKLFKLFPNDMRYILPIPELIIKMTGMPQNER